MRRPAIHGVSLLLSVLLFALTVAACGSGNQTLPTLPSRLPVTETFSGSIDQGGGATYPFAVPSDGTVTITLTAVAPLLTMALGVAITNWDGTTCSGSIAQNDNSRVGTAALTGTATAGNYCVRVYDSGNIPDGSTVTFTVQVVHP